MKIENLHEGMVIKNYKELCKLLEINVSSGNGKIAQVKNLGTYCKYHKEGYKIIIDEIYKERKKRENNHYKKYPNFKVSEEDFTSIGIYKIQLCNNVYIGSTVEGFRARYQRHIDKSNTLPTRELLRNGAEFTILEKCNGMTEPEVRNIENEWIRVYSENPKYTLVNKFEAQSLEKKPPKPKYKRLKVREEDYEELIRFIEENNLRVVL